MISAENKYLIVEKSLIHVEKWPIELKKCGLLRFAIGSAGGSAKERAALVCHIWT
jgi:hypothetical protein